MTSYKGSIRHHLCILFIAEIRAEITKLQLKDVKLLQKLSKKNLASFLVFIATIFFLGLPANSQEFQISSIDYQHHMQLHRVRILELGQLLFSHYKADFPALNALLVNKFLLLHDLSKVDDSLSQASPISKRLASIFGKSLQDEKVKTIVEEVRAETNRIDKAIAMDFFVKNNMAFTKLDGSFHLSESAKELLRLERIVDLVDRGFDPVASLEFGRQLEKASQSEFFLPDARDRQLAQYLEYFYKERSTHLESHRLDLVFGKLLQVRCQMAFH